MALQQLIFLPHLCAMFEDKDIFFLNTSAKGKLFT